MLHELKTVVPTGTPSQQPSSPKFRGDSFYNQEWEVTGKFWHEIHTFCLYCYLPIRITEEGSESNSSWNIQKAEKIPYVFMGHMSGLPEVQHGFTEVSLWWWLVLLSTEQKLTHPAEDWWPCLDAITLVALRWEDFPTVGSNVPCLRSWAVWG